MVSKAATAIGKASLSYESMKAQLVDRYVELARSLWRQLGPSDWWNDAVTTAVAAQACLQEMSMIAAVRSLAVSYADETLRAIGVTPSGGGMDFVLPRQGTDPWYVALRVVDEYRRKAGGSTFRGTSWPDETDQAYESVSEWLEDAFARLEATAQADAMTAGNMAAVERYRRCKVLSYRRVIHPELSRTGTCGLCAVAADRWYSTDSLLPLHQNCKCTVAPAGSDEDPGFELNKADLDRIYGEAGGRDRSALSNVRVTSYEHGELGPVLTASDARRESAGKEWKAPTAALTRETMERLLARAREFDKRYEQLEKTGEKRLSFRLDGRSYEFRKGRYTARAHELQRKFIAALEASLDR